MLTRKEVARLINWKASSLNQLLSGKYRIGVDRAKQLATQNNMDWQIIVSRDGDAITAEFERIFGPINSGRGRIAGAGAQQEQGKKDNKKS
jgi:transcriptional regulator with XRE-family HTH domain